LGKNARNAVPKEHTHTRPVMIYPTIMHVLGQSTRCALGRKVDVPLMLDPHRCVWHTVHDTALVPRILETYFGTTDDEKPCDLFLIDGVPAASILYESVGLDGGPVVDQIHMNKGLIMMFDAGSIMRAHLFQRYVSVNLMATPNHEEFLMI